MQKTIGERIKSVRQRKQMSQAEVADKLNISQSSYAKLEQGASRLDVERLMELSTIFEVPYHELLPPQMDRQVNFNNSQINNGFIEHFYEDSKASYEQHIKDLKAEVEFLRELLRKGQGQEG